MNNNETFIVYEYTAESEGLVGSRFFVTFGKDRTKQEILDHVQGSLPGCVAVYIGSDPEMAEKKCQERNFLNMANYYSSQKELINRLCKGKPDMEEGLLKSLNIGMSLLLEESLGRPASSD